MTAAALLLGSLAGATTAGEAPDAEIQAALHLLYDGSTDGALARFDALDQEHLDDPLPVYFGALAFAWKLEQRPETRADDAALLARADRAIDRAGARLRGSPSDARALFARGAAHGVKSRLHLFRRDRRRSASEAVRMREDLRRVLELQPDHEDARFGVALYDYYADVLPRMLRLVRLLAGIPGGDRERGLGGLRRAAERARWHGAEAREQLYEIFAFYEDDQDQAVDALSGLRERYPGSPLWGLKLTEQLRDRLSLYVEAAGVAREIADAAERGHPNYAPLVARMGDLALGHALLLDLRLDEARRALSRVERDAERAGDALADQARLLRGRSLELEGDRPAALPLYRAAAASRDATIARAGRAARDRALPASVVAATPQLARGRRLHEAGRAAEGVPYFAAALRSWPQSREAALRVAAGDLVTGHEARARDALRALADAKPSEPFWVRPEATLLLARLTEEEDRLRALALYKQVLKSPGGRPALRAAAAGALERLDRAP